jgi:hypothetical protein
VGSPRNVARKVSVSLARRNTLLWETAFQAAKNYVRHAATCCRIQKVGNKSKANAPEFHGSMSDICEVILSFQRLPLGTKNELFGNIRMYRDRLSTEIHDKVYSVLGLIRSPHFAFSVNYRCPYVDVCCGVVVDDIKVNDNLNALMGIRHTRLSNEIQNTPSMAIDWSSTEWWAADRARIMAELYRPSYSASGGSRPRLEVRESGSVLAVAGQVVDEVVVASESS